RNVTVVQTCALPIYVNNTSTSENLQVKLEYIFSDFSVDEIKALPIPIAPSIPTNEEILIIKTYLDNKYPLLLKNSPRAMEDSIYRMKNIHKKEIETFKESHKII